MTWEEIRAAYPPGTWIVLEVRETHYDRPWQHYVPIRVLDVVPPDTSPMDLYCKRAEEMPREHLHYADTSDEELKAEVFFNGLRRAVDTDAEDLGSPTMRVINLRASRDRGRASQSRGRHGGSNHDPR